MDAKNIVSKYSDIYPIRTLIQNIPIIGGTLDAILADTGSKWREQRFEYLVKSLDDKIRKIANENEKFAEKIQAKVNTEEFYDLFLQSIQKSLMTHNREKIDRFANILLTYLDSDLLISQDYYVEIFLDITDTLSEKEITFLSSLQKKQFPIYYSYRDKAVDLIRFQEDIEKECGRLDFNDVPQKYEYEDVFLYCISRLEKVDLVKREETSKLGGSITVGWKTQNQSENTMVQYKREETITISEFGKKYIGWITS